MENQRQKDEMATPRGSTSPNETNGLECQTGTTALIEPKGQFVEVANPLLETLLAAIDRNPEVYWVGFVAWAAKLPVVAP